MDQEVSAIQFLESYVMSNNRLKTVTENFNEETEEYWRYSLLYMLNKSNGANDAQVDAFLQKLSQSKFSKNGFIENLLFRNQLRKFDQGSRPELIEKIKAILGGSDVSCDEKEEKEVIEVSDEKKDASNNNISTSVGTLVNSRGTIEVDIPSAIAMFLTQSTEHKFTPSAVDFIVGTEEELDALNNSQVAGIIDLLKDSPPNCRMLLPLILRDMKDNDVDFGARAIHYRLTVDQMNNLGILSNSLFKDINFVLTMARKLRPISDVYFENNEKYMAAYFDKLRAFAFGPLQHTTFKALILYNYLVFFEGYCDNPQSSEEAVAAFQASEYGNEQPNKKIQKKKTAGKGPSLRYSSYDRKTLATYLSLLRQIEQPYSSTKASAKQQASDISAVNMLYSSDDFPELKAIINDVPFVERALSSYFLSGDNSQQWEMVLKGWALVLYAKTKLMTGKLNDKLTKVQAGAVVNGKSRKYYQRFASESQLVLFPTNPKYYSVADAVTLQYWTKNNPEIIINVFQLNPLRYYREHWSEIPLDLNLNGVIPKISITKKCKDKSTLKKADQIVLKSLAGQRGVFMVDFIGNGITQRAMIVKGEYRFVYEQSAQGYEFYVFDELNIKVNESRIYSQNGGIFNSDENGKIVIPYLSENDDCLSIEQSIIVEERSRSIYAANVRSFRRCKREWTLKGGFYIDRESLMAKEEATLIVRANLYLCQEITDISLLRNTYVTVEYKTLENDEYREIHRVQLSANEDTIINLTIPAFIREISCVLNGCVCSGKKQKSCADGQQLSISQVFRVNGIDACPFIADVFLLPDSRKGYYISTLGKNGEIFPNERMEIKLFHRFFSRPVSAMVTTNEHGVIELGQLQDIYKISVQPQNTTFFSWNEKFFNLLQNMVNVPARINQKVGIPVRIPFSAKSSSPPIISVFDTNFSSNVSNAAVYANGYVTINQLPPGDYFVYIEDMYNAKINLHISNGSAFKCELGNYVLSNSRILQLSAESPLQIESVSADDNGAYAIKISNSRAMNKTRVHVIVSNLLPSFTSYQLLSTPIRYPDVIDFVTVKTQYSRTCACDEEYLYIMNRKRAKTVKYIGNNLYKPSLIQCRWQPPQIIAQITEPPLEESTYSAARFGHRYQQRLEEVFAQQFVKCDDTSDIEFLKNASLVFTNLKPDDNGIVHVPAFKNGSYRCVQILAIDDENTALFNHTINANAGTSVQCKDIRLDVTVDAFKVGQHFALSKNIVCLKEKGDTFSIRDFSNADYTPISRMSHLLDIYCGLVLNDGSVCDGGVDKAKELNQFRPIIADWHSLNAKQRLEAYDTLQCNEINFFLSRKDPTFFEEVVQPELRNKLHKDFMDLFLLGSDLSQYHRDWQLFSSLNVFEQILLCARFNTDAFSSQTLKSLVEQSCVLNNDPNYTLFNAARTYKNQVEVLMVESEMDIVNINDDDDNNNDDNNNDDNDDIKGDDDDDDDGHTVFSATNSIFKFDETLLNEERRYFNISACDDTSQLVRVNLFWRDFAIYLIEKHGRGAFLSEHVLKATTSINEILLALACVDLPLDANDPIVGRERNEALSSKRVLLTADASCILFVGEFVESEMQGTSMLGVHSNYFDPKDSSEILHGEKVDKFVVGNFETRKIYGCRSVITNVSSIVQEVEVVVQIPCGSIPVNMSNNTRSILTRVQPFKTERVTSYFYFPAPGKFSAFPVHVNSKSAQTISYSLDERLNTMIVGKGSTEPNRESWDWLVKSGSNKQVLSFLEGNPRAYEVDISLLGSRLSASKFFDALTACLKTRGIYDENVWRYSLTADKGGQELLEFLAQSKTFLEYIHPYYQSKHFNYDPFERCDWTFTQFFPLINARSHAETSSTTVVGSPAFIQSYARFLLLVAFRSFSRETVSTLDRLMLVSYLLNQGRVSLAKSIFCDIDSAEAAAISQLAYDYFDCYFNVYSGTMSNVQQTLMKCMNWTVRPLPPTILNVWKSIQSIAEEVENPSLVDAIFDCKAFEQKRIQNENMFGEFDVDFSGKVPKILIRHRNVDKCELHFYKFDLELLFSESPFTADSNSYSLISANSVKKLDLSANKKNVCDCELPEEYRGSNSMIECFVWNSAKKNITELDKVCYSKAVYDHHLLVQFAQSIGECRVIDNTSGKPVCCAYVKLYSRDSKTKRVSFYKDGYTDIRGRFNYRDLSSTQQQSCSELAMLVSHPRLGTYRLQIAN